MKKRSGLLNGPFVRLSGEASKAFDGPCGLGEENSCIYIYPKVVRGKLNVQPLVCFSVVHRLVLRI